MMHASPTQYSSLPSAPTINALPGGIPQGPWSQLYRSAPGASIPAGRYPGMMGAGLGAAPVTIMGFGQGATGKLAAGALNVGMAAASGAVLAWAVNSPRPLRTTAMLSGGMALLGVLMQLKSA
jgi:hypothetical protein